MESISVWHAVMLLLIIGIPVTLIIRSRRRSTQGDVALVGFGGWLLLLAIGQTLAPLRTVAETGKILQETYDQLMLFPPAESRLIRRLREIDPDRITPLDAIALLAQLRADAIGDGS